VLISSCQDKIELEDLPFEENPQEIQGETPLTKALSYQTPSISNPGLHSNWESVNKVFPNGQSGNYAYAPWSVEGGNSNPIPEEYRMDIKREDGWMMVSHTLIDIQSTEPNYIIFYNKRSCVLKVFYYLKPGINNNSLIWMLESATATSVFPSNTILQGVLNATSQYATSNNVIQQSESNFGQLCEGWNAFSIELVYGTTNNKPNTVSIKAFNQINSTVYLGGNFTGQVQVPKVNKNDPVGAFSKILTSAGKVVSGIGTYVPVVKGIGQGISAAASVLGGASGFFPKSSTTVYTTLQAKGKVDLTGSVITNLGGAVASLYNIPLANIINEPLGLWNLKQTPQYSYDRYQILTRTGTDRFMATPQITPQISIHDLITVNPNAGVKNYKVLSTELVKKIGVGNCMLTKVANDHYFIKNMFYVHGSENPNNENLSQYNVAYVYPNFTETINYITVTVEFEFTDGTKYISSRNYGINLKQNENPSLMNQLENQGKKVIVVYGSIVNPAS
ncbi:MAG: hypothetical protein LUG51_11740, partial [Tannerellaceae bacterium]|nr:hypothetical protein [Tannerellaceae bacterium]